MSNLDGAPVFLDADLASGYSYGSYACAPP